jgi:hypothetical protein
MKNVWVIYVGYGVIALQMLGVMKKQNVRALNSHKPRNLIQKSNDIFKCGRSFKLKLINHYHSFLMKKVRTFYKIDICCVGVMYSGE